MKGIIYCRVSSKEQIEGTSLDSQQSACEEFARAKNIEVVKVFIERGESAKRADRTELLELIEFCRARKGKINTLIVWKVDRFARNVADHFSVKATLAQYGVGIASVTEPIDTNPMGKLMETMLAGFAEFDNDIRAMRSVQGMRRKLREGIFPWKPPLGYKSSRVGREKKNRPDEPEQPLFDLLQRIWREFATGTYTKVEIRRLMDVWGVTTRRGEPLSKQSVDIFFKNSYYAGILTDPWSGDEFKGLHQPMTSVEEFAHVQQIMKGRGRSSPHLKHRAEFPLRGFARCPECHWYLTGSSSRGRSKAYHYYHCYQLRCPRRGKAIPVARLDNEFKEFLLGIAVQPPLARAINTLLEQQSEERQKLVDAKHVRVVETGKKLTRQLQQLISLRTQQFIGDEEFQTQRADILERRQKLSAPLYSLRPLPEVTNKLSALWSTLYNPLGIWEGLPIPARRRFQQSILPVGFDVGKVGTAERAPLFRLELVFADEENVNVPLTSPIWNQIEKEILTLWDILHGPEADEGALPIAV